MNEKYLKVASFQGHAIEKNPSKALDKTLQVMEEASSNSIDILCMPESYLHGYLKTKTEELVSNEITLKDLFGEN